MDHDLITKQVLKVLLSNASKVSINDEEATFLNSLPLDSVFSSLKDVVNNHSNITIQSRAFDSIMKLRKVDKVAFLIDVCDNFEDDWKYACCEHLAEFSDARAINKLCDILFHGRNPSDRWKAAKSLSIIGNAIALNALEYAKTNDNEVDYEGFPVADICEQAMQEIRKRLVSN
jgi:hypothetical protein